MNKKYLSGLACIVCGGSFAINSITLAFQNKSLYLVLVVAACAVASAAVGGFLIGRVAREQSVSSDVNS